MPDERVPEEPTDAMLMAQLAEGNAAALGVVYQRYAAMVHALVRRYAPALASSESEDVCQESFLTLFQSASRYHEQGRLRGWLCGIAVRKAKEARRNRRLRDLLLLRWRRDDADTVDSAAELSDTKQQVARALETLAPPYRDVLLLHVVEQLETEEIAAALGISRATVFTRLHRARAAMRAATGQDGEGGET